MRQSEGISHRIRDPRGQRGRDVDEVGSRMFLLHEALADFKTAFERENLVLYIVRNDIEGIEDFDDVDELGDDGDIVDDDVGSDGNDDFHCASAEGVEGSGDVSSIVVRCLKNEGGVVFLSYTSAFPMYYL